MERGTQGNWCILMTAGPRTLPLVRSLAEAGMRVWTPVRSERRTGRGKLRQVVTQVEVPLTSTFVFVGVEHLPDLLALRDAPTSQHPAFRLLRHQDRIPVIHDAALNPLRAIEDRFRQAALKAVRRKIEPGTKVRITKGAFAGMSGVVEGGTDKDAKVCFGNGFSVKIASYLFGTDVVQIKHSPDMGIAA